MVEFIYGDKTCKFEDLKGNEQHSLTEILKALGIEANSIDGATSDADDLFAAENGADGWMVVTKQAFGTQQTLTVIVDGVEYVLNVIDDEGASTAADLQSKINAAGDGHLIYLEDNMTGNITVDTGKTITIDLRGKTLKNTEAGKHTINVKSGKLIITDSVGGGVVDNTVHGKAALNVEEGGEAIIEGGTFTRSEEAGNSATNNGGNSWYTINNLGTLTIEDGTVTAGKDDNVGKFSSLIRNCGTASKSANLTINGGTFNRGANTIKNDDYGVLTINGGTFRNTNQVAVLNWNIANINGGYFETNTDAVLANKVWKATPEATQAQMTIKGGTFNNTAGKAILIDYISDPNDSKFDGSHVLIADGQFNGKFGDSIKQYVDVIGGTYNDANVVGFVPLNDVIIGTSGDKTLVGDDVVNALLAGETVELTNYPEEFDNVTLPLEFPAGATVINKTGRDIILLGTPLKNGESMTIVAPAATTGEVLSAKYYVVDGKGQEWTKGSADGLKFELNSDKVVKVLIDGVEVEFTVENGEIIIAAEVLEALEAGEHEIEFVFDDGSCKTEFIIK